MKIIHYGLKKLILIFLVCSIHQVQTADVSPNLTKLINVNQTSILNRTIINNRLEIIQPIKPISDQLIDSAKNLIPTSVLTLCNFFKNPYLLLIKGEMLALTYLIYINSCNHNTTLIQSILEPQSIGLFLQKSAPYLVDGLIYATGEAAYKKSNKLIKKIAGPSSVALVSLNFICPNCFNNKIPEAAKKLITAYATESSTNLIQEKTNKKNIKSIIKNPIVIGSVIAAGVLATSYIYNCLDSENIVSLVPTMINLVEQSVFYTYAYRLGKSAFKKLK